MSDASVLGQLALCYAPVIDPKRAVKATRLTVFPLRADAALDAALLLDAVAEVWPAGGGEVWLNVQSESLLGDLLRAHAAANLVFEVPSFMAGDPAQHDALLALRARGNALLLKGRPVEELPRELLPCFSHAIVDLAEDRRIGEAPGASPHAAARTIPFAQSGIRTMDQMQASFKRGAAAVLGWPIDDVLAAQSTGAGRAAAQGDMQVIVELIHRVDREESIDRLEQTLRRDPTLAFKLLRYINSPAFGLRVEISSFAHAIMMLGHRKLKRWLALLLATARQDANLKPVMFAAVRRGLLMEELGRSAGDDEMRSEMFICGVFSLLDRMFDQPFADLLKTIPVPERVAQALVEGGGPYHPYFELVRAIEGDSLFDVRAAAESLLLGMKEVNHALLRALAAASQID
ncbi:MAG TPA: HDOD domain-containing protein [Burkholderiaceae bacterium]|nr:HDOD domain-containing protein [Burkholderiaceae bacterium]